MAQSVSVSVPHPVNGVEVIVVPYGGETGRREGGKEGGERGRVR